VPGNTLAPPPLTDITPFKDAVYRVPVTLVPKLAFGEFR
jgi:hypothetical protein